MNGVIQLADQQPLPNPLTVALSQQVNGFNNWPRNLMQLMQVVWHCQQTTSQRLHL